MADMRLPREMERVERFLTAGPRPEPSAALRWRVLSQVQYELREDRSRSQQRWAVAIAATLLIGVSVSMAAFLRSVAPLRKNEAPPTVDTVAWRLQQVSPNLSREEALRQALLRNVTQAGCLVPFGDIPSNHERHNP
jgi:hypothetical protein